MAPRKPTSAVDSDGVVPARSPRRSADLENLRKWLAACKPFEPLDVGDPRYFDFTATATAPSLRGPDHLEFLKDPIVLGGSESCQLFSGFRGTGKSTELRKLKSELEDEGFSVILADFGEYHDLVHPLTFEDLLVVIAAAFGEEADRVLGRQAPQRSFWDALMSLVERVEVEELSVASPESLVGLPIPSANLKLGLRNNLEIWQKIQDRLAARPQELRKACHEHVAAYVTAMRQARPQAPRIVFILDSLERISGLATELDALIESVVRVFTFDPDALRLPGCHAIYTIPPYVQLINPGLREAFRLSVLLPSIKILERGPLVIAHRPGIDAMVALLTKRIPQLPELFASTAELQQLIIASGGHVRTLLYLVTELLYQARREGLPIEREHIEAVAQPLREQMRFMITRSTVPFLDEIRREGKAEGLEEGEYAALARYMDNFVVLCYRNGDDWYEVHPLVRDHLADLASRADSPREIS